MEKNNKPIPSKLLKRIVSGAVAMTSRKIASALIANCIPSDWVIIRFARNVK